jgi:D-lyxose ketol-isomerase
MKRSVINNILEEAKEFFNSMNFHLPPWALWSPKDWAKNNTIAKDIIKSAMGWDITDFGSEGFYKRGLLLFTLRNGIHGVNHKIYAEKIMIVRENQETPMHFHFKKMEDIINRGGGNLVLELYNCAKDESLATTPVNASIDGIIREIAPGSKVILTPGESITLIPGMYHRFYGEAGKGLVLVGEVSSVNDDTNDNRFHENVGRFPAVEEDTAPIHLLVNDYQAVMKDSMV